MMLVDALREDFVQFEKDYSMDVSKKEKKIARQHYLDLDKSVYKGPKIDAFLNLVESQPENAILMPM
jgi:hypothetical protein